MGDTQDRPLAFLCRTGDYLWLCGALAGRDDVDMIQFWTASQVHPTLGARIREDPRLARVLAEALGRDDATLAEALAEWVRAAHGPQY